MAADQLTGIASSISIGGAAIPITKYSPSTSIKLANTTDNSNYSSTTNIISPSQIATTVATKISVEGWFHLSVTPAAIVSRLYAPTGPYLVSLGLDAGVLYGHGYFDISEFNCEVPVEDTVSFTCTLMSNGVFTPGS